MAQWNVFDLIPDMFYMGETLMSGMHCVLMILRTFETVVDSSLQLIMCCSNFLVSGTDMLKIICVQLLRFQLYPVHETKIDKLL